MADTIFDFNSRVERTPTGIKFYEKDILACSYEFENNLIIDMRLDYLMAGFGIVMAESNDKPFKKVDKAILFRIGFNDFSAIEKYLLDQNILIHNSCVLAPSSLNTNIHLIFTLKNKKVSFDWYSINSQGKEEVYNLGQITLKRSFSKYKIGFYSSAGNTIREVSFLQGVPENWHTSIKNVRGGRMAFFTDGFKIENCEYDAEIEQENIKLNPGTYWVSYDTEELNNKFDIDCIIFPSETPYKEMYFEDPNKNLLKEDGTLVIPDNISSVNIKFKGTNGIIKNIALKEDPNSSFIETEGEPLKIDGSYMTIILDKLKKVRWRGTINSIPQYTDLTKPPPYAVIETVSHRTTIEETNTKLKKEYGFIYDVEAHKLSITDITYTTVLRELDIELTDKDNNRINVFRNLNGYIYEIILTFKDGSELNVLAQKTFKVYVPADINSPIIVTEGDKKTPFDLSSSYREVSTNKRKLILFRTDYEITLNKDNPFNLSDIKVYGIPASAQLNLAADTIDKYTSDYSLLDRDDYHINNDTITLNDSVITKYKHVVVDYISISDFDYLFTNYEREIFTDLDDNIELAKSPLEIANGISIYGIPKEARTRIDYIYRVPSSKMINSIDYYADKYDIIAGTDYTVNYLTNEVDIKTSVKQQYDHIIIDYLKNDSYCINYVEDYNQYEVDIASNQDKIYIHYNMHDDGGIYEYKTTEIKPDKDKYILLKKVGDD